MKRFALMLMMAFAMTGAVSLSHAAPDPASDAAHAADDHGGGHEANPIASPSEGMASGITAIVLFAVVFGILSVSVWPKITKGLDERNEKIKGEIAAAESARQQAKDALDEYEKNLAEARAESQRMLEETKAQQGELAAQLRAKADAELSEMRERAMADIEAAKKQALSELYTESVTLATVMAGKILQREVGAGDEQRLMDESLAEMKSANA